MKTVSVSEAREQLSSVINWAAENQDDVVIQNRGQARAVIIPYTDYQLLQAAREQQRKQAAIAELQQIADEVRRRNQEMSSTEADAVGDAITREALDGLIAQSKVVFEA